MHDLYALCENILIGYGGSTILFLIVTLFYEPFQLKDHYLSISNRIAMVCGVILAIAIAWTYITNILNDGSYIFFGNYTWQIELMILLTGIVPLLFCVRKLRTNRLFTLLVAILLNIGNGLLMVFFFFHSHRRDYLPAQWSCYRSPHQWYMIYWVLGYFLVSFLIAGIKMKRANVQLS